MNSCVVWRKACPGTVTRVYQVYHGISVRQIWSTNNHGFLGQILIVCYLGVSVGGTGSYQSYPKIVDDGSHIIKFLVWIWLPSSTIICFSNSGDGACQKKCILLFTKKDIWCSLLLGFSERNDMCSLRTAYIYICIHRERERDIHTMTYYPPKGCNSKECGF